MTNQPDAPANDGAAAFEVASDLVSAAVGDVPGAEDEVEVAQSILTLTEISDVSGGFTIGMKLHAFSGGSAVRVPPVDIIAIALSNILKTTPDYFKEEIARVNTAVDKLSKALLAEEASEIEVALSDFNAITGLGVDVDRPKA